MHWKRPLSVPVGQVWARFNGKEFDGKPALKYQIRDVEVRDKDACLDMMQQVFMKDEPLNKALGLSDDLVSVAEVRAHWEEFLSQNISIACYTEVDGRPDELVGFNTLLVYSKDDDEEDLSLIKGTAYRKILRVLAAAESLVNIYEQYGVDHYLTTSGLAVVPSHRRNGIAAKMMKSREEICKACKIPAFATVLTAVESQAVAKKCDYEFLAELKYADMMKYGIDLSNCSSPKAEVRGKKFSF